MVVACFTLTTPNNGPLPIPEPLVIAFMSLAQLISCCLDTHGTWDRAVWRYRRAINHNLGSCQQAVFVPLNAVAFFPIDTAQVVELGSTYAAAGIS